MKKRISLALILMFFLGMLISFGVVVNHTFEYNFNKDKEEVVELAYTISNLIDKSNSEKELLELFNKLNNSDKFGYYYVSKEGEILYSEKDLKTEALLKKYNRYENIDSYEPLAIYDKDLKLSFYIETIKLENGNFLVLTKSTNSYLSSLQKLLPILITLFGLSTFISLYISERTVENFVAAIEENARDTSREAIEISSRYKEFYPLIRIIKDQNEDINNHINMLQHQSDTIKAIISNMQEGMILLDKDMNILSINESAIKLADINYADVNFDGINLTNLIRNSNFKEALDTVAQEPNKSYSFDIKIKTKILNLLISPVINADNTIGFVIFLVDETQQKLLESQRSEFSANVSHELKTPLTSINGYAEMLMTGFAKPEDTKKFGSIIYNEGKHLLNMIDDIIKISRLDEGETVLATEKLDLVDIVNDIIKTLEYKLTDKNITIEFNPQNKWEGYFNKQLVTELLLNLIDNGIKYNKENGKVSIKFEDDFNDNIIIRIKDTGLGISQDDQKRIFERFYTVDKSHNKRDSSGLGLAIVKHIVKILDGEISLQSKLGVGTEFIIKLPKNY